MKCHLSAFAGPLAWLVLLVTLTLACNRGAESAPAGDGASVPEGSPTAPVSRERFLAAVEAGEVDLILDVRTPEEFAEGRVAGAVNVPHDRIAAHADSLEPHKTETVVVYCRSGRRAALAEAELRAMGFTGLLHLEGDMNGWVAAERPVDRSPVGSR